MRLRASHIPPRTPCTRTASSAYAEQLGLKRQCASGPKKAVFAGEITRRYRRAPEIKIY
jgi:hypothetical protein